MATDTSKINEDNLNELPSYSPAFVRKLLGKVDQITHPKGYEKLVKRYVDAMKKDKNSGRALLKAVGGIRGVSLRSLQTYINNLVAKGVLPKELKAEFEIDERRTKQDPDIKDREGTQPAKYYAKDTEGDVMSPSTKKKRAAHFAKKKKGPAPGDASATTRPSKHTQKFKQMYGEAKAVAGGKVHKFIKGHNLPIDGKKYKEIEFETKGIDNASKTVKLMVIHPKKIFGKEFNVPFKTLRMGPFTKLDIPNQMEVLGKDADMGDYIKDFEKSDSPQFKGKSKEKRKDMAIAAYLSRNETMIDEAIEGLKNKSKKSGISYSILKKVYDRGMAAYKTGHRPGTTSQQWAMARVNSFITKGSGTWGKADKDLADKVRGEAVSPEQQAAIAISKKKKASEKSVKEWFEANATRAKYQLQHGDDWWWKMNETHDAMLEKLGLCCDDCLDEASGPCWDGYKQVGTKKKGGKVVPNCVPEETEIEENAKVKAMLSKMKGVSSAQAQLIAQIPIPVLTQISQALGQLVMGEDTVEEDRDYKKEYENYQGKPEQIKRRAARNSARNQLKDNKDIKGKDVHHKDNNPMNNDKSNLSIVSKNYNRKEPRLRERLVKQGIIKNGKR